MTVITLQFFCVPDHFNKTSKHSVHYHLTNCKMNESNLLPISNELTFQQPIDLFGRNSSTLCSELSSSDKEFEAFDAQSGSHLPAANNLLGSHQHNHPQLHHKLVKNLPFSDFSTLMNVDHVGGKVDYAPNFLDDQGDQQDVAPFGSDSFRATRNDSSFEAQTMRSNGETILNFVQNCSIGSAISSSIPDVNYSPADKRAGFDLSSELLSDDDEVSLESIIDMQPLEEVPNSSCEQKRDHDDSFLNFLQVFSKSLSRRNSSTCTLREFACQIEQENFIGDQQVRELTQNAVRLSPLTQADVLEDNRSAKRIKLKSNQENQCADIATGEMVDPLKRMCYSMEKSAQTMKALQEWDRKKGLPKSHCQTMVNTSRSREQLQSGLVLQKWNGVPLLMLPGAKVKVTRRKFRGVKVVELED